MIQAVIPTIPGREHLLAECVASLDEHGIDPVVVRDSPSCGEGWEIGLQQCVGPFVLLCSDDFTITRFNHSALIGHLLAGRVLSPIVHNPDGTLQGAGGMGLALDDGDIARNCICPLAPVQVFEQLGPWPRLNHYCDTWITMEARRLKVGPFVTSDFQLTHHSLSAWNPAEYDAWRDWLAREGVAA